MKPFARFALTGLLMLLAAHGAAQETRTESLRAGGLERRYVLHLPEGLPAEAPLVIVLHGYGGDADPERFGMNATADRHRFAVCYPQGERDGRGKRCWNVGYPFQADMPVDDIRFLEELIDHLHRRYGLSRRNVFCTGMSNGGDMCYLLAVRRPELFAALGPVAGFMSVSALREDESRQPVPLFEIHGTLDRTTHWEGDLENRDGWGAYLPIPMAVGYWAAKAKCLRNTSWHGWNWPNAIWLRENRQRHCSLSRNVSSIRTIWEKASCMARKRTISTITRLVRCRHWDKRLMRVPASRLPA